MEKSNNLLVVEIGGTQIELGVKKKKKKKKKEGTLTMLKSKPNQVSFIFQSKHFFSSITNLP